MDRTPPSTPTPPFELDTIKITPPRAPFPGILQVLTPTPIPTPPVSPTRPRLSKPLPSTPPASLAPPPRVTIHAAIRAFELLELFELQQPDELFDKENLYVLTKRRRELEEVVAASRRKERRRRGS